MKINKRVVTAFLVFALLICYSVLADVYTTGNVNLRAGPGLDYATVGSVPSGTRLTYLGETSVDERGVAWYMVDYKGTNWVSSKYSELSEEDYLNLADIAGMLAKQMAEDGTVYSMDREDHDVVIYPYEPEVAKDYIDAAPYYLSDLEMAADALRLENYREVSSEAPYQYYCDTLTIGAYQVVEFMSIYGPGYTFYGAAVGMDKETVKEMLTEAGLVLFRDDWCMVFEHPSDENSLIDCNGFDSCINVYYEDGIVTGMDWSTYTG